MPLFAGRPRQMVQVARQTAYTNLGTNPLYTIKQEHAHEDWEGDGDVTVTILTLSLLMLVP